MSTLPHPQSRHINPRTQLPYPSTIILNHTICICLVSHVYLPKYAFSFFTCLPSSLSFFVHFRKLFLRLDHVLRTVFKKISFVFLSLVNLSFHKIFFSAISLSSGNFRHCIHFCTSFYITRINQNMLLFF
jgi:hypothetical protein